MWQPSSSNNNSNSKPSYTPCTSTGPLAQHCDGPSRWHHADAANCCNDVSLQRQCLLIRRSKQHSLMMLFAAGHCALLVQRGRCHPESCQGHIQRTTFCTYLESLCLPGVELTNTTLSLIFGTSVEQKSTAQSSTQQKNLTSSRPRHNLCIKHQALLLHTGVEVHVLRLHQTRSRDLLK